MTNYMQAEEQKMFFHDVLIELKKAREKFPKQDIWKTLAALTEEVGELNECVLQINADSNPKGKTAADVYKEAVQITTMAMRVIFDTGFRGEPE